MTLRFVLKSTSSGVHQTSQSVQILSLLLEDQG